MSSATTAGPRLSARGVGKAFHGNPALIDVDLDLHGGEMLALVGANGAGKSTLVKIICGAYTADDGVISVDGKPVEIHSVSDALAAGIAVAHQQIAVIPALTAAENVMLGREPLRGGFIRNASLYQSAREIIDRFGIDIPLDRDCEELDEGENKIVDILKAMENDPAILILDEPTASLTLAESRKLFAFLRGLKSGGTAILFISHHLAEVFAECDRVVVLKDGRKVHESAVAATTPETVVQAMVGRAVADTTWSNHAAGQPTTILRDAVIAGLHLSELTISPGEIVGLAGVVGGGQTQVLEALAGAGAKFEAREIVVNGKSSCPRSVAEAIDRGVYLVAEERIKNALFPGLSIAENLLTASLRLLSRAGFVRDQHSRGLARDAISRLSIKCEGPDQDVLELSGGNQQKVAFARWLLRMAKCDATLKPLLLLDNPTEGVDVGSKAEIYQLIQTLARGGASVLITSTEFPELLKLCDRIYCITHKSVGACLPRADFSEERLLLAVS
jgi:ABC-type sugar transport system ATPase subunit